jgi:hypothetical protein
MGMVVPSNIGGQVIVHLCLLSASTNKYCHNRHQQLRKGCWILKGALYAEEVFSSLEKGRFYIGCQKAGIIKKV